MEAKQIQERLKEANAKVKTLASGRDQIIHDAGIEKQKLTQAYENLRQYGIEAETMTEAELQGMASKLQAQLTEWLQSIEEQLTKGDALMKEYQELQEN